MVGVSESTVSTHLGGVANVGTAGRTGAEPPGPIGIPVSPPSSKPVAIKPPVAALLAVIGGAVGLLAHKGLLNGNVHTVVPGSVYRSAQLNPRQLQRVIARYGVRTVISLRGGDEGDDWFCEQGVACGAEGAGLEGITFSARRLPHPGKLKKLLRAFDRSPYPLLFHCRGGADRTGMAATLYLHLYAGVPLDEAQRRGLTWRYGHFPFQAAPMGEFFDLYRAEANGLPLREWIREEYPRVFQQHRNIDEPGVG